MKKNHAKPSRAGLRSREVLSIVLNRFLLPFHRDSRPAMFIISLADRLAIERELSSVAEHLRRIGASCEGFRAVIEQPRPLRRWSDIRHNYDEGWSNFSASSIWEENGKVFVRTTKDETVHLTDRDRFNPDERYWEGQGFLEEDLHDFIQQTVDDLPF